MTKYYILFIHYQLQSEINEKLNKTAEVFHPYRLQPKVYRENPRQWVKVNITTDYPITGHGGLEQFDLNYICRKPAFGCNSATQISPMLTMALILTASLLYLFI